MSNSLAAYMGGFFKFFKGKIHEALAKSARVAKRVYLYLFFKRKTEPKARINDYKKGTSGYHNTTSIIQSNQEKKLPRLPTMSGGLIYLGKSLIHESSLFPDSH